MLDFVNIFAKSSPTTCHSPCSCCRLDPSALLPSKEDLQLTLLLLSPEAHPTWLHSKEAHSALHPTPACAAHLQ